MVTISIIGFVMGFGFGVGCALAVMYGIFLHGYRAALRDAELATATPRLLRERARLASERAGLASQRTRLASERTQMASEPAGLDSESKAPRPDDAGR